ncbi:MAG: hypothetical protein PVJ39_13215 [Gammaproteobacteria bacterium]|jgi:hypothetical protein
MGAIVALIIGITIYSRITKSLVTDRKVILDYEVTKVEYIILVLLFYAYLIPFFGLYLPIYPLGYLFLPYPIGLLIFIPGILVSKNLSTRLETSGVDYIVKSGKTVSNIMWLGVLGIILFVINWLIVVIGGSVSIW